MFIINLYFLFKGKLLIYKEEYSKLKDSEKENWLKEKGYKAEDFDEDVLDNSDKIRYSFKGKKTARYINKKLDTPTLSFIRNELRKMYGPIDSAIADGIAIEKDNSIYVVDSGMEDGRVEFGVREKIIISDENLRKAKLEKINDRAISKGYVSIETSRRIKHSSDNDSDSSIRRELSKKLSDNTRKSENNESGIFEKDATDGSRRLKFSLKDSDGNTLSPEQQEYFKYSKKSTAERAGATEVVTSPTDNAYSRHSINYSIEKVNTNLESSTQKLKFSLKDTATYTLSDGQVKKKLASVTKLKVYSKVEAERIINSILETNLGFEDYEVEIACRRTEISLKIADYIIIEPFLYNSTKFAYNI